MDEVSTERFMPEYRRSHFKNRNRFHPDELRRRREDHHVSLRKAKRDEELLKRRKIYTNGGEVGTGQQEDVEIRLDKNVGSSTSNKLLIPQLRQILAEISDESCADPALGLKILATLLSPKLSDTTPPIDEAVELGFVPVLMKYMASFVHDLQYHALWALANIASGTESHTKLLIEEYKIIPALLNLISCTTSVSLKEEAVLCLGNLCIDNLNAEEVRNTIIIGGGLVKLIDILTIEDDFNAVGSSIPLKRKASWVFMQLCKTDQYGRLPSSNWNVLRYIIPQVYYILDHEHQDMAVLKDVLKALEFLTNELLTNNRSTTICDFRLHSLIIQRFLARKKYTDLKLICIQIMKNLITATSQKITQTLISEGLLRQVFHIFTLASSSDELKRECCSLIALMHQCSADVIQQVFSTSLIPHLIHCLKNGSPLLKVESCHALCNAIQFSAPVASQTVTSANLATHISKPSMKIVPFLVSQGILSPLVQMSTVATVDLQIKILKSVERILATGEFLAQTGEISSNEYVMFFIEAGGREILDSIVHGAMNDEDSALNVDLMDLIEDLSRNYVRFSDHHRYDSAMSTNSSDISSSDYQFQFHTFQEGDAKMSPYDDDIDNTMAPSIGDDGFFKFG